MAIQYPDKPWTDGQSHQYELADGTFIFMVYDEQKNTWTVGRKNEDGQGGSAEFITTADVATLNARPTNVNSPFQLTDEPGTVINQQEANWWLFEDLDKRARKAIVSDTEPTSHPLYTTAEKELIKGDLWVDTDQDILFWYDGSNWQEFSGGRPPIFSDTEPTEHPDFEVPNNELIAGDIWYDTTDPDSLEQYIYDGTQWIDFSGQFVRRKGGDSMEGPLKVTGPRNVDSKGLQSSIRVLNVDSDGNSSLELKFNGASKVYVGNEQTTFQNNIKFNVDGRQVYAGNDNDKKGLAFSSDGVQYFGDYTKDEHVATKLNVEEAIYHDVLDPDTNKYVDRSGDVMDGDLVLEESRLVFRNPVGDQTLIRGNREVGKFPVLLDLVNNGSNATLGGYDIKIGGSTSYNQLRFVGQDTYLTINGGGGSNTPVKFHKDVDCGNNLFKKLGTPIDETDAANKKYVDDRDEQLRQDIIELEEEIDAIAPSVEYGTWVWKNPSSLGRPPAEGEFYLLDDAFATTEEYANTKHIVIHDDEYGGTGNHSWLEADPGKLIQLFDAADPDFLLGEITNTDTRSGHVIITVDLIQTNGTPGDTVDSETGEFLTRINIFEKPSGGDASGFVLKTGDDMSGALKFNNNQDTFSYDVNDAKAKISFVNKTSGGTTQTSHIYQAGDLNTLVTNADLRTRKAIYVDNTIFGWNGSGSGTTTNPRIVLGNSNGELKWGTNKILQWNSGKVESFGKLTINVPQPSSNDNSFVIQGRRYKEGTSILEDNVLLKDYRREITSTLPDYIAYYGDGGGDYEIANKKYVDSKALPSGGSKGQVLKKDHATGNTQWQGAIDINPDGNNRAKGEMWFNQNDGTLYLKVS